MGAGASADPRSFALETSLDCVDRLDKGVVTHARSRNGGANRCVRTGRRCLPTALSYLAVYRASPLERISMIKRGVHATDAKHAIADLSIGQGTALKALNRAQATVIKKAKQAQTLLPDESERVIGLATLVCQLKAIVQ